MGTVLGFLSFAVALAAGTGWFRLLRAVEIGNRRPLFMAAFGVAVLLGAATFFLDPGVLGGLGAIVGLTLGGTFLGLGSISGQSRHEAAVVVGGPVLDFESVDTDGAAFASTSLAGKAYLLKFFRGHW